MPSKEHAVSSSNHSLLNVAILSTGTSLMDMLNQQPLETADSNTVKLVRRTELPVTRSQNSDSSRTTSPVDVGMDVDGAAEQGKLSTLFNTTGRERNSTGPLKQWLYQHQDHPYPTESDRQMLMAKTKMTSAQVTIWFTNARVKMRKEKKLAVKVNGKKQKKNQDDDLRELKKILDLSFSSDDETSDSLQSTGKPLVIAYSCLNSEQITNIRRFAVTYADHVALSDQVDDHTTHLIMGNEEQPLLCPLTMKLFQAIARHLYVISYQWITECFEQNQIVDQTKFEMRGDIPFGGYHDGMRKSRLAKQVKLFQSCQFFMLSDGCQDKMSKTELASLIKLGSGSLLDTFPLAAATDNTILTIVLCDQSFSVDSPNQQQLLELSRSNGVHFLGPEWVLESIVQFALQPFDAYEQQFRDTEVQADILFC